MKTAPGRTCGVAPWVTLLLVGGLGCEGEPPAQKPKATSNPPPAAAETAKLPAAEALIPPTAKKLAPDIYFERIAEGDRRRVYVECAVCLREGNYGLECFLCRKGTKEHESILSTTADARLIHGALEAAGAKPGSPAQFVPKFQSATGQPIRVTLRYSQKGKTVARPAQEWVKNVKTNKHLDETWVFAGSSFYKDPDERDKPPVYLASAEGAYISVTSVPTAMLDLPINSPKGLENREFAPFTERIPDLETKVIVILEPIRSKK